MSNFVSYSNQFCRRRNFVPVPRSTVIAYLPANLVRINKLKYSHKVVSDVREDGGSANCIPKAEN